MITNQIKAYLVCVEDRVKQHPCSKFVEKALQPQLISVTFGNFLLPENTEIFM